MFLLEQALILLSIFAFSVGVLYLHLRLRNKASLTLIISFCTFVAWGFLKDWVFHECAGLTIDPALDAEKSVLNLEQQANITAETFAKFSACDSYETISSISMIALMLIFCVAFLLSARSIRRG
mgnify:CR=1 FL=1